MNYKDGVIYLLFGFIIFHITSSQSSQCRTPNNEFGKCLSIKRCPELILILRSVPLNPMNVNYLRASQCSFQNGDPFVCCPIRNISQNPYSNGKDGRSNGDSSNGLINSSINGPTAGRFWNQRDDIAKLEASSLLPIDCGRDLSNRIIGGNVTELDEFPWMALLEYHKPSGKTTACGGVLISKRYVLTAAHCIKGRSLPKTWNLVAVRLGEYNTATERDCIPDGNDGQVCAEEPLTVPVEEQIAHTDYAPETNGEKNDIALLRLSREVTFTNFVKPICLPSGPELNKKFQVAGWGRTESKSESEVKLKVTLGMANKAACAEKYLGYGIILGDGQICAGGEKGKDSCRGDSGGPLMQQDRTSDGTLKWKSVGVVSFGPSPCGMPGWPGVYTKLYDYMPWILNTIRP